MIVEEDQALVSVVVTSFNYGSLISSALKSIDSQTYRNVEVIVVDDGSTDGSHSAIAAWAASTPLRYTLRFKEKNEGVGAAVVEGLELCNGSAIAILDADDRFTPNKLSLQVPALLRTGAGAIYSDVEWRDAQDQLVADNGARRDARPTGSVLPDLIRYGTFAATNGSLFSRSVLMSCVDSALGLRTRQDYAIWLQLARKSHVMYVPGVVGVVRRHETSLMRRTQRPSSSMVQLSLVLAEADLPAAKRHVRWRARRILRSMAERRDPDLGYAVANALSTLHDPSCVMATVSGLLRAELR